MSDLGDLIKSSEISAKSSENLTGSSEISPDLVRSPLDLVRFRLNYTVLAVFLCR